MQQEKRLTLQQSRLLITFLKNKIDTNLTEVDFLKVTFNLDNSTYRPHKKPNDKSIYIDVSQIIHHRLKKQPTKIISNEINSGSFYNADIFNSTKLEY